MTPTVLARGGRTLDNTNNRVGWIAYLGDGWHEGHKATLLVALLDAQRAEFNTLLPQGYRWYPDAAEIIGPVGTELPGDLDHLMLVASGRVLDRFAQIEQETSAPPK